MKISLELNFPISLRTLKGKEDVEIFNSFIDYCLHQFFEYNFLPQTGDLIKIDDIIIEWSKKLYKTNAEEAENKLFLIIDNELKVRNVIHSREFITLDCTDEYERE